MSKYEVLWNYIKNNNKDSYELYFSEVHQILGFDIDHSFLAYKKELIEYDYEVVKISLKEKKLLIRKIK